MTMIEMGSDELVTRQSSWRERSSCLDEDPEIFFAGGGVSRTAKKICASCPVREQCLELSVRNDERFGIWGGLTWAERKALTKHRPT
ncbi:WhiB family redox-sensing transcriptional regulator [Promicromonospora sp. AC04]|uniref:WhiB family transcriptional regulator n=1 Tax=Promicromonospora sp. AC04 TaxID=2135723 RepID=UPI000D460B51|nr:WhiB family transcriptional regulator [Promicromonospora sp. AC04]PUB32531.1 WhiB family redox-sensing transcriptional regulator [Promicromonospora sp. AC04]